MKTNNLLYALPKLSDPWQISSATLRRQKAKTLSYSSDEITKALNVLEQCLEIISVLTLPPIESIPESIGEYWDLSTESLAKKMPTLDDLNFDKVAEFLKEEGIKSLSEQMVEDVAISWLWSVAQDIVKTVLRWLEHSLKELNDAVQILHFINIAEHYWLRIDPPLAQSLLSRSAIIGWEKALPLLDSVENNASASSKVKATVQDYKELILGVSNKNKMYEIQA
jgi:hypothetical protein